MPGYGDTSFYGEFNYKQDVGGGVQDDGETDFLICNKINAYSGKCLRYGVHPLQHGQGYSVFRNRAVPEAWIWPEPQADPLAVVDNKGQMRYIILDETTGKWHEIGTRQGPAGTDVVPSYQDKIEGEYQGSEIPCALKLREHTSDREHKKLEHNETHVGFRPQKEESKGVAGYGANGLRTGFELNVELYKDGNLTEDAIAMNVPLEGDVVVDRKTEARRLQVGLVTTTSEFRLTYADQCYVQKDAAEVNKAMSEHTWQAEFAAPLVWLTRGQDAAINQATGEAMDGSYFDDVTGPESV
jgi:hypothetical protein